MKDNGRFILAIHMLTLLAEKQVPLSSNIIALSAGVNAVTVRKLMGQLREAKLIHTQTGVKGGTTLAKDASKITLKDVFMAVRDDSLFGVYSDNPSQECSVGRNLKSTLSHLLRDPVNSMINSLDNITITDVLNGVLIPEIPSD